MCSRSHDHVKVKVVFPCSPLDGGEGQSRFSSGVFFSGVMISIKSIDMYIGHDGCFGVFLEEIMNLLGHYCLRSFVLPRSLLDGAAVPIKF